MMEVAGATKTLAPKRAEAPKAPLAEPMVPLAEPKAPPDAREQGALLAVLRAEWSTLARVAAAPRVPGPAVAAALAEAARAHRLRPVRVVDASRSSAAQLAALQDEIAASGAAEARLVFFMEDPRTAPGCAPLLVNADATLVVVRLGATEIASVEEVAAIAGRERVIGCIVARGA